MSKVMRTVKNVTKGYSSVQVKVRNATSNDPWGPTGTEMSEIAQMTYNSSNEFYEIMDMLDKRLNDKGKNWRHVLKALKVLDYCLHEGSELVVTWAHKNIYIIKTLREFQYIDEDGKDVGQNVRVSAKELTALVLDEERLRSERSDRKTWKSRVSGIEEYALPHDQPQRRTRPHRAQRADEEDAEYRLAIEASKHQEEEDRKKRQSRTADPEDDDLAKAIKLSKEEEDLRRRELEDQNASSLFDDDLIQTAQPTTQQTAQPTGFNQGYQQQGQVDWSGNPIDPNMQQQPTGYMGNMYTGAVVNQQTGYPNGYQNGFGPQPTGAFDPYGSQQLQQQQLQPQQTSFNPYQTSSPFQAQPQAQEPLVPASTNNPWATNQQQSQQIMPTPTGSNNPFASSFNRPQATASPAKPTLAALQEQKTSAFNPIASFTPPPPKEMDPHQARLNALLASGEGMDTFGNTGDLRIPAQHTAPGTFVNSAGAGLGRMTEQQTGTNPFLHNQYTGMPQTTYGGNQNGFGGHQVPAATGPAGVSNGFGNFGGQQSSNPFGARPQQKGPGGDLIQF
ncbi:ENTH protein [Venustampulla echinocandica]|uniref:ENTH protein n=1 Tax=Venustampulla echinocandica TaxID=2656787 RepID=A0A370TVM3_9HELO|nr:ENTH protein [Venustampulla echinocandica]RDL39583.1 ENTH protein [Venustampulla echinocandica]